MSVQELVSGLHKIKSPRFCIFLRVIRTYADKEFISTKSVKKMEIIIDNYTELSMTICEICGSTGMLQEDRLWLQTLCDDHDDFPAFSEYVIQLK